MPDTDPRPKLLIKGLSKTYGPVTALEPTHLAVEAGEFLTLLGPSGSGKTTLLQMIAGLTEPTSGELWVDGRNETHTPVNRRDMGVVFQHYALFPHMTVAENVAFPLKMRGMGPAGIAPVVAETLAKVQLEPYAGRFPRELSGGQQQRVALARCFVYRPKVILMDEPLGALDKKLRENMQFEIKRLHREFGTTVVYVTHDQEEALALSDRICVMNHAKVEQVGTPHEIYAEPRTIFAADFIGTSNIFQGTLRAGENGHVAVETPQGRFTARARNGFAPGDRVGLVLRPEQIAPGPGGAGDNGLTGAVREIVYAGSETRLLLDVGGEAPVTVRHDPAAAMPGLGDRVSCHWAPEAGVIVA